MNILILGGCGYTGSILTQDLLLKGHKVTIVDQCWFGNYLAKSPNLKIIKKDISKLNKFDFRNVSSIIHLANIANDPGVELNAELSWEVNVLNTYKIINQAINYNVKQFIYASSGSVYGVKSEKNVTEDLSLNPISTYNKTKMIAERLLISYSNKIKIHCIRPATVCGYSPRIRLDVSVNNLTFQALKNKKINVFGGKQIRPNIHIRDLSKVYQFFVKNKNKIKSGFYNAGFENISILSLAKKIQKKIPSEIIISKSNDPRSYRQNSDKLFSLGFSPEYNIDNGIDDIIINYNKGLIKDKNESYNVKMMKKLKLGK